MGQPHSIATSVEIISVYNAFGSAISTDTGGSIQLLKSVWHQCAISVPTCARQYSMKWSKNYFVRTASHSCIARVIGSCIYALMLQICCCCWSVSIQQFKNI